MEANCLINRILIIEASGSGTSTLGEALAGKLNFNFFEKKFTYAVNIKLFEDFNW
jgi:adenylate kinase family enzyme